MNMKSVYAVAETALLAVASATTTEPAIAASNGWFLERSEQPLEPQSGALFGSAVSADAAGFAIGEPRATVNGIAQAGRVAVRLNAGGPQASIIEESLRPGVHFGAALAIAGDRLRVGAPDETVNGTGAGSVSEYGYNAFEQRWSWQSTGFGEAGDHDGYAVAITGDLIGEGRPGSSAFPGGYVATFYADQGIDGVGILHATNGVDGDFFGASIALYRSPNVSLPDLAVVGAPYRDRGAAAHFGGAAYVFANPTHTGMGWQQVAYLTADNPLDLDLFGFSVAAGPSRVVIGAPGRDRVVPTPVSDAGAVFVFTPDGSGGWQQESQLFLANAAANEQFGTVVAYDPRHDRVFGAAPQRFHTVFGGSGDTGSVTVFKRTLIIPPHFGWLATAELFSDDQLSIGQQAGRALSVSGDRIFVGAPNYDANPNNGVTDSGRVLVFAADEIFGNGFD